MMDRGFHFVGQIKQNHRDYLKKYLEKTMEQMAPSNWIVLENMVLIQDINRDLSFTRKRVFGIGYKYSYKKVLCFIITGDAGDVTASTPYKALYCDRYGKRVTKMIDCPRILNKYFR